MAAALEAGKAACGMVMVTPLCARLKQIRRRQQRLLLLECLMVMQQLSTAP